MGRIAGRSTWIIRWNRVAPSRMGVSIPDQVMVAGFDGLPQSAVVEPALSTIQIPSTDIGRLAADLLLARIGKPDRPYCTTYVKGRTD